MSITRCACLTACLMIAAALSKPAFALWSVTYLNPAGCTSSCAYGISGSKQVGYAKGPATGNSEHASLWTGTAASWVDLNPAGCTSSQARAVSDDKQVGASDGHAGMWTGTAASWVDLNPAGCTSSCAYAVSDNMQAGEASGTATGDKRHASLWTGTAASWVDIHPTQRYSSVVYGISGNKQAGATVVDDGYVAWRFKERASIWTGTAASWVDIHPAGDVSSANAFSGDKQAGYAGFTTHASIWTGTAASWVDIHPAGWCQSRVYGAHGDIQVGDVDNYGSIHHACLWAGTPASWVDLHLMLSASYEFSTALGVYTEGDEIWVVGYARSSISGYDEAILWHYTPVMPTVPTVSDDGRYTTDATSLHATWHSEVDPPHSIAEYSYAIGTSPTDPGQGYVRDWTSAGAAQEATATALTLVPHTTYYFYVKARSNAGVWSRVGASNGIMFAPTVSLGRAKATEVGYAVHLAGTVVTSTPTDFAGFWVESSDRAAAMEIPASWSTSKGDRLQLVGVVSWQDGLPCLTNPELKSQTPGDPLRSLGISNDALANDKTESLQYIGINPVGLLVTTWGTVTRINTTAHVFYVNDGSDLADGMGPSDYPYIGLRVAYQTGWTPPAVGKIVRVTGIRTVEKTTLNYDAFVNGEYRFAGETLYLPVLTLRDAADIRIVR